MELGQVRVRPTAPLVLIVDDDKAILELVTITLENAGYRTLHAMSGWLGWETVKAHTPDAVLLDIDMPGMDGFALLASIRRRFASRTLPVIMMTAHGAPRDVAKAIQLGATDYLTKPFSLDVLLRRVGRATLGKGSAPSPEREPDGPVLI